MRRCAPMVAALLLSSAVLAAGSLEVIEPWATVSGQQAEVYLTLRNAGTEQDRLIGASSPLASSVKLLTTVQLGSVSSVQPLKSIGIPAGGQQVLAPGHTHMVLGLKRPLAAGDSLPLTLQFEKAGNQPLQVKVKP
ncbi:copper(I)-binding protein [Pseudomonas sp. TE3786]